MKKNKVWKAGRAPQEELDEIDGCDLCERLKDIMPNLSETCYATKYCHRQIRMQIDEKGETDGKML